MRHLWAQITIGDFSKMLLDTINNYLLIFHQEVGGFDILEAFRLAKDAYMEGWDTGFALDGINFTFYDYFGENWADMHRVSDAFLICRITPYGWHIYEN